jgi:hypothetical protein
MIPSDCGERMIESVKNPARRIRCGQEHDGVRRRRRTRQSRRHATRLRHDITRTHALTFVTYTHTHTDTDTCTHTPTYQCQRKTPEKEESFPCSEAWRLDANAPACHRSAVQVAHRSRCARSYDRESSPRSCALLCVSRSSSCSSFCHRQTCAICRDQIRSPSHSGRCAPPHRSPRWASSSASSQACSSSCGPGNSEMTAACLCSSSRHDRCSARPLAHQQLPSHSSSAVCSHLGGRLRECSYQWSVCYYLPPVKVCFFHGQKF